LSFFVYVILNDEAGRRYVGQTDNLQRRLAEHNGESANPRRFTAKSAGLVHHEEFSTRAEAMRREKWLKSGIGRRWLDGTVGRASPPQAD
jgi:putative endonuclease